MNISTRYAIALAVAVVFLPSLLLIVTVSSPAKAQSDLTLEAQKDVRRGDGGSTLLLDEVSVPSDLQGLTCVANVVGSNNPSTHPGNDLLLVSASTEEFSEVEAVPDQIADDSGSIVLGDSVQLELRFGPGGVSSAGWVVVINCPPPSTTTSTPPTSVSTTVPTSSTTQVPPTTLPPTPPESNPPVTVPDYTG